MRLTNILGSRPVLMIIHVHKKPAGVDFMIIHAGLPKGQRLLLSGFLPMQEVLERFTEVKAKYEQKA